MIHFNQATFLFIGKNTLQLLKDASEHQGPAHRLIKRIITIHQHRAYNHRRMRGRITKEKRKAMDEAYTYYDEILAKLEHDFQLKLVV